MKYDEFIYELIKLLMSWGTWKDSVKIIYGDNIYAPCQMPPKTSDKFFDYEEYMQRSKVYDEMVEKSIYRGLKNVVVSKLDDDNKAFLNRWDDDCEMFIELNGPLVNLFEYGILETNLSDLPLVKKIEAYQKRKEYQEAFRDEYDEEEIQINPELFGLPSELEFDSADEYREFIEAELNKAENEFISNLSGIIIYDNDLEAEICDLCINYGLSYECTGWGLYIGHDYF